MSLEQTFTLGFDNPVTSFTAANGTQAQIVIAPPAAGYAGAIAGEVNYPGEGSARPRMFWGGALVKEFNVSSTDSANKELLIYNAVRASLGLTGGITSQNVITRTDGGSYLTDGWRVGQSAMMFDETAAPANNGVLVQITAVTATVMTVNGTPFTNVTLAGTPRLFRVAQRNRIVIPLNSGTVAGVPNVNAMQSANDKLVDIYNWRIGERGAIICAMAAAVSALPARIDIMPSVELV